MKHLLLTTIAALVVLLFGGVNEVNADPMTYEVVGDTVTKKIVKRLPLVRLRFLPSMRGNRSLALGIGPSMHVLS